MTRFAVVAVALLAVAVATAAPVPKVVKPSGILVLDDCDPEYKGKDKYADNLTCLDAAGKQTFQLSGFNTCQAISSSRAVAVDSARSSIWTAELVAHRIRRFDLSGKEAVSIEVNHVSAVAVDPQTGNVWATVDNGQIGTGKVEVYDPNGKKLATHDLPGWDIVYDPKSKAFWVGGQKLTKIGCASGEVSVSIAVSDFSVSSLAVDPNTGAVWAGVRGNKVGSELLKFDADGKELHRIALAGKTPFRVSVDPKDGGVWVANFKKSVERFSADGKSEAVHAVEALAVQVDPAGDGVWVVTPTEVQKMTAKGEVTVRAKHAAKTSQAWIAAFE